MSAGGGLDIADVGSPRVSGVPARYAFGFSVYDSSSCGPRSMHGLCALKGIIFSYAVVWITNKETFKKLVPLLRAWYEALISEEVRSYAQNSMRGIRSE